MKKVAYRFRNINTWRIAKPLLLTTFISLCFVASDTHYSTLTSWQRISTERRLLQSFSTLPLAFEMNQGQADSDIRYFCRGNQYGFYLLNNEVVLSLAGSETTQGNEQNPAAARTSTTLKNHGVIRMQLKNANPEPRISGLNQLPGKTQYFIGNDPTQWHTGIANFARVAYREVYPGIDVIYYGNQNQIEHDFIVSPGANPDAIQIRIEGAEKLATDDEGNVDLKTSTGSVLLKKPYIYQQIENQKRTIHGQYIIFADNRSIGFQIGRYDVDRPLVIDPVLVYSTKLGGGSGSAGRAIAIDKQGCAYVAGRTLDSNFPVTSGAFQTKRGAGGTGYNLNYDAFVTKFNTEGSTVLYSTYLGGKNHDDEALGIAVDSQGNAYVTGVAWSTDFPTTSGAFQPQSNESKFDWFHGEVFVAKLNPTGTALVYSTYLGGEEGDCGTAIDVNAEGEAFVTGYTSSQDFPVTTGAYCTANSDVYSGGGDAFVAKLNREGSSLIYSTFLGAKTSEEEWLYGSAAGCGIAVDAEGNAFITGEAGRKFPTTPGAYQAAGYCFVAKLNPSGSDLVYSTCLGHSAGNTSANKLRGIAIDKEGCAYVTGYNWTGDFPVTSGAFQSNLGSGYVKDAVVTKLNSTGSGLLYSSYFGGSKADQGTGIAVDDLGKIYIVGVTESDNLPVKNGFQNAPKGNGDAFVAIFDPSQTGEASLIYSTYMGGSNSEVDQGVTTMSSTDWYDDLVGEYLGIWTGGIAVDAMGNAYVTGMTNSEDFPTSEQAFQRDRSNVAFVAKIGEPDTVQKIGIWQDITLKGKGTFSTDSTKNLVTFDSCKAEIISATKDSLVVRVPTELDDPGTSVSLPDDKPRMIEIVARVVSSSGDTAIVYRENARFIPPKFLLYDEVTRANPPVRQELCLLPGPRWRQAFNFIGKSTDGMAAVRVLNTSVDTPPLTLLVKVEAPNRELFDKNANPTIGNLLNIGICNAGVQFPVTQDGIYRIIVEAADTARVSPPIRSWGPFPALFQIHLAGNTGLPRKLINGVPERARSLRLDTYFNHPAPRYETLERQFIGEETFAETGLFKFANPVSVNRSPIAVLIPPVGGFSPQNPPVRAAGPGAIGLSGSDLSVPQARTSGAENPVRGTVIDIAQIPIPASVMFQAPPTGVAAILGASNSSSVTLPYKGIDTLICDMGSGNEIVDGAGKDFQVIAAAGIYSVAVSNTPFNDTFVSLGSGMNTQSFDLASTGLTFARYVRISGTAVIDAIESINYFADRVDPPIGALEDVGFATITMRRQKGPVGNLDPYLELIGPDGSALGKDDSGFGDDTDMTHSDAALVNIPLSQPGFHRFLGRGYDTQPDERSFGTFFTRLETGGVYDQVEIAISSANEEQTQVQKKGIMNKGPRQRDSYLFQAEAGKIVNIVVNGVASGQTPPLIDPLVELYDPEDFLIAANDDYPGRGKNATLYQIKLPEKGRAGGAFPNPSTYRIVVCGMDVAGAATGAADGGTAYIRTAVSGGYEVKVFTGSMSPGSAFKPIVSAVTPAEAVPGASGVQVQISGANFLAGAAVSFNDPGITVRSLTVTGLNLITAVVDVAADAIIGKKNVSVTNQNGLAGSGLDLFEIRTGLGTARLSWQAPAEGALNAPPADLNLIFDYGVRNRSYHTSLNKANGLYSPQQTLNWSADLQSPLIIIDETEPNNSPCEPQKLAGDTVIVVNGKVGYYDSDEVKDEFDCFKFTTTGAGLVLQLNGFTLDCDLYLFRYRDLNCWNTESITYAMTRNDTASEKMTLPDLQTGMYVIWVTYTPLSVQSNHPTPYQLLVKGQFEGGVAGPVQSYNIYRSAIANARRTGDKIASVPATQTSFADPIPHTGQFYYQVTAVYSTQESEPSNEVGTLATRIEEQGKEAPSQFALQQNYPNPFNGETTILFETAESAHVKIYIYNNLGQIVRVLVDGPKQAGVYQVLFNAADLVSGVYFCRMQAGSFVQMKKLLLLR